MKGNHRHPRVTSKLINILVFTIGALFGSFYNTPQTHQQPLGIFRGPVWTSPLQVSRRVVHETPFARCEVHSVLSEDGTRVMEDWLWFDEIDAINVVVHEQSTNQLLFFQQQKYGLKGDTLATVGGFQNPGEEAIDTCERETREELGMASSNQQLNTPNTRDPNWIKLGNWRTACNRGAGYLTSYLLLNAVPVAANGGQQNFAGLSDGKGTDLSFDHSGTGDNQKDGEAQLIVRLSLSEAREALHQNRFLEVKWSLSVSLALQHLEEMDHVK